MNTYNYPTYLIIIFYGISIAIDNYVSRRIKLKTLNGENKMLNLEYLQIDTPRLKKDIIRWKESNYKFTIFSDLESKTIQVLLDIKSSFVAVSSYFQD